MIGDIVQYPATNQPVVDMQLDDSLLIQVFQNPGVQSRMGLSAEGLPRYVTGLTRVGQQEVYEILQKM